MMQKRKKKMFDDGAKDLRQERKGKLEEKFKEVMEIMGLDLKDLSLKDTPSRIAKMYEYELFRGIYEPPPDIKVFPNNEKYNQMITIGPLNVKSTCEHHFAPFLGYCYVSYIPKDVLIGASKFSRILNWYMRRPQLQERLTQQIANYVQKKIHPQGVGVYIKAQHMCMVMRGVEETNSWMVTTALKDCYFDDNIAKSEFLRYVMHGEK